MKHLEKYRGIFPAFYTCYNDSGEISTQRNAALARFYAQKGVSGLYVEGSSGECIYQSTDERKKVLDAVLDEVGGEITVIAHVAAPSTKESIELANHAKQAGADAISAIPGLYYFLSTEMVERYWQDISAAADIDMIIYNIPQTTGFALSGELFERMLKNKHIIGVKNSSMMTYDIELFKSIGKDDVVIFNGSDEQYISGRMMGAEGGIGGTYGIMPELYICLEKFIANNQINKAKQLQREINTIIRKLISAQRMYSYAKGVLKLRGIETGGVRLPLLPLMESDDAKVRDIYSDILRLIEKYELGTK